MSETNTISPSGGPLALETPSLKRKGPLKAAPPSEPGLGEDTKQAGSEAAKKGGIPAKAVEVAPKAGDPQDPIRVGDQTEDRWAVGRSDNYWTLSRRRREKGGENELTFMANTKGGGLSWKQDSITPFGQHFALSLGYGIGGTYQKAGDFHVVSVNPSVRAGVRLKYNLTQLDISGSVDAKAAVAHNPKAQSANQKEADNLGQVIEENFEAFKQEVKAVAEKVIQRGEALKNELESLLAPARERFAQMLAERLSKELQPTGQAVSQIVVEEITKALGAYMAAIGDQFGQMADNLRKASTASTPAGMQSALGAMASNMTTIQALMNEETLHSYMQGVAPAIAQRLEPVTQEAMTKIGVAVNEVATEVGKDLAGQMKAAAGRFYSDVQGMGGELWQKAMQAYANSATAANEAWNKYQSAWQAAYGVEGSVGLRLHQGIPFMTSPKHSIYTNAYLDARYSFPIASGVWADKGAPIPEMMQTVTGPRFRAEAGLEATKWLGSGVGVTGSVGVSTQHQAGSWTVAPVGYLGVVSRF